MESLYFDGANTVEWRTAASPQLREPEDVLVCPRERGNAGPAGGRGGQRLTSRVTSTSQVVATTGIPYGAHS